VKLKSFGLVVAMTLALTAFVGAPSASASGFENINGGPTTISGSLTGSNHTIGMVNGAVSCSKASFAGNMEEAQRPTLLVSPALEGCGWGNLPITWGNGGCNFTLRPGLQYDETSTKGWLDIVDCVGSMGFSAGGCTMAIGNQKGLASVQYQNVFAGSERSIKVIANLSGLTYTLAGACGATGKFTSGTYKGEWIMKGSLPGVGLQKPIAVELDSVPNIFAAEEAPVKISGKSTSMWNYVLVANGILYCGQNSLSAESGTETTGSIVLTPTYKECFWEIPSWEKATVSMGGCNYVLRASGLFDIAGVGCAGSPMTITTASCTVTIGPQIGLSGFSLSNVGSGVLRSVTLKGEAKKLNHTIAGKGCYKEGTFNGVFKGGVSSLTAVNSMGVSQGLSVE
jgi:hypothetical protein